MNFCLPFSIVDYSSKPLFVFFKIPVVCTVVLDEDGERIITLMMELGAQDTD